MTIKVYSTKTCPYCKLTKEFLNEKGITFTDIDVAEDPAAANEMVKKSGQMGVPVIDDQHRDLIGDLNRLLADTGATPSSQAFGDVLSQLGLRLGQHFQTEERYFQSMGLTARAAEAHRSAHAEILQQYTDLNLALMHRSGIGRAEVLRMVRHWVVEHIVTHDARLGAALRAGSSAA